MKATQSTSLGKACAVYLSVACSLRTSRCVPLLVMATLLSTGCNGVNKNRESDFLKPLATSAPSQGKVKHGPMPSERSLCIETAKTVAEQGHAVEAIKLYQRAEQLDPNAAPLDSVLAPLYANVGNLESSIKRYQRCIQRSPDDADLANNYAWTLMEAGRFDQAIAQANRGLKIDADNRRLRSTLALIYYRQGDRAAAMQQFQQVHSQADAHYNLAILDIDAGNLAAAESSLGLAKQSAERHSEAETRITTLQSEILAR